MTGRLRPSVKAAPALLVPLLVHSCIQLMFARCLPGPVPALRLTAYTGPVLCSSVPPGLACSFFLLQGTVNTFGHLSPASLHWVSPDLEPSAGRDWKLSYSASSRPLRTPGI